VNNFTNSMPDNHIQNPAIAKQILAPIIAHAEVAPSHFRMRLKASHLARHAVAGQFVHVLPRDGSLTDPMLRRAFSILSIDGDTFEILYRVMGRGTKQMSGWAIGQEVDVIGPLGQPFAPLAENALLVGGGVGVPPMAMLASRPDRQQVTALIGARSADDVLCLEDFQRLDVPTEVATQDGSMGHHGLVTELLEQHLIQAEKDKTAVYSCGPLPMLRAVAALCERFDIPCQVSLEENMPCGVGICNGCVAPVVGHGDDYSRYRRICIDGPVCWSNEIDWTHWETPSP